MVEFGSLARLTDAVFVSVMAFPGAVTAMEITAVAPIAIGEVMEQETGPVPEQDHPAEAVAETNVAPAGRVSVSTFAVAGMVACPRF